MPVAFKKSRGFMWYRRVKLGYVLCVCQGGSKQRCAPLHRSRFRHGWEAQVELRLVQKLWFRRIRRCACGWLGLL
jgi:hypothetical protein